MNNYIEKKKYYRKKNKIKRKNSFKKNIHFIQKLMHNQNNQFKVVILKKDN